MNNTETATTYRTYSFLIRGESPDRRFGSFYLDVVACDYESALADVREAYDNPEVITWSQHDGVIRSNQGAY